MDTTNLIRCCDCKYHDSGWHDEWGGEPSTCEHTLCFVPTTYNYEYGHYNRKRVKNMEDFNQEGKCPHFKPSWWTLHVKSVFRLLWRKK